MAAPQQERLPKISEFLDHQFPNVCICIAQNWYRQLIQENLTWVRGHPQYSSTSVAVWYWAVFNWSEV